MKELISIKEQNGIETVNARELHYFLESQRQFGNWIQNRTEKYGFKEGMDFITELLKSTGGRPTKEYYISIDMAKELSMVENNAKGREARQYFIAREKQAKLLSREVPTNELEETLLIQRAVGILTQKVDRLQTENAELKPKAELADTALRDLSKHYSITDAGKHIGIRQSDMFSILRSKRMLTKENLPTQRAIDYRILTQRSQNVDGRNRAQAVMTMENIYRFIELYGKGRQLPLCIPADGAIQ